MHARRSSAAATRAALEPDAASRPESPASVSEVTAQIKDNLEGRFVDVWVTGEVSNLVRASSGHIYLSLKDEAALLRGVIWRASAATLAIEPSDGMAVVCHGHIEVYAPRGTYQLTIDRLHALGTGTLEAQLRRLFAKLDAEGLLSAARKRPIPEFPKRIAVVTSPTGAAIADFLQTLRGRWRSSDVVIIPSRVQGAGAAEELAAAIATAEQLSPRPDVIALVRGGGSLEDLWSFNEEVLVRAVANSAIPIVAGIGHEIDVTLADLAADMRALTPTDAAVKVSPDGPQLARMIANLAERLPPAVVRRVDMARERLAQLARSRIFVEPAKIVVDRRSRVEAEAIRLQRLAAAAVLRGRERLVAAVGRLEAGSPLHLLARGWSLTSRADAPERALRCVDGIEPGTELVTQLAEGRIWSRVSRTERSPGTTSPPRPTE